MTQFSVHDTDRVRLITFDRPDNLNAFDSALYAAAADALAEAAADDEHVHAVVLTGAGRAFSAGQDLGEVAALREGSSHTSAFARFVDEYARRRTP